MHERIIKNTFLLGIFLLFLFASFVFINTSNAATYCTSTRLAQFQQEASNAAQVCLKESNDNPANINGIAIPDIIPREYSVGLFQINLCGTSRCQTKTYPFSANSLPPDEFLFIAPFADPRDCRIKVGQEASVDLCAKSFGWMTDAERDSGNNTLINNRLDVHFAEAVKIYTQWSAFKGFPENPLETGCDDKDAGWCPWGSAAWCSSWLNYCPLANHPIQASSCPGQTPPAGFDFGAGRGSCEGDGGGDDGEGGPGSGSFSSPKLDLKLEVTWPAIPLPGGSVRLNDFVEGDVTIKLGQLIVFVFGLSIWMGGIIAFIMLVYVGMMYMLSGANPGLRAQAKERLKKVLLGMAILFGAVIILNIIDPRLVNLPETLLDGGGGGFKTAEIEGPPHIIPSILTLTANEVEGLALTTPGEEIFLEWSSVNLNTCSAGSIPPGDDWDDVWDGEGKLHFGSQHVTPLENEGDTRVFSLTCSGVGVPDNIKSVQVTVSSTPPTGPPVSVNLWIEGQDKDKKNFSIQELGWFVTFQWESTNASTCSSNDLIISGAPPSGKIENVDIATLKSEGEVRSFMMTCFNSDKTLRGDDTVTITQEQ